jgi:hypothetical protein
MLFIQSCTHKLKQESYQEWHKESHHYHYQEMSQIQPELSMKKKELVHVLSRGSSVDLHKPLWQTIYFATLIG